MQNSIKYFQLQQLKKGSILQSPLSLNQRFYLLLRGRVAVYRERENVFDKASTLEDNSQDEIDLDSASPQSFIRLYNLGIFESAPPRCAAVLC